MHKNTNIISKINPLLHIFRRDVVYNIYFCKNKAYMSYSEIETHPFPPFLPSNAKILMLGTFPPQPSRWSMEFYYPNKINDMWRIMGIIFFDDKNHFWNEHSKSFKLEEIKSFLNEKGIALYDTGVKIRRLKGNASDKFLEIVEPINLNYVLEIRPSISAIITAGEKAAQTLSDLTGTVCPKVGMSVTFSFNGLDIHHYRLPSSSRAYPLSLENKAVEYSRIFSMEGYEVFKKKI